MRRGQPRARALTSASSSYSEAFPYEGFDDDNAFEMAKGLQPRMRERGRYLPAHRLSHHAGWMLALLQFKIEHRGQSPKGKGNMVFVRENTLYGGDGAML